MTDAAAPAADPPAQDEKPKQSPDAAAQAAAAAAAAAADAAGFGDKKDGSDGRKDPYELLAELTGTEEGQQVFAYAARFMNGGNGQGEAGAKPGAKSADAPAATQADVDERKELERLADGGDAEAALKLRALDKQTAAQRGVREQAKVEVQAEALAEVIAKTPQLQNLPQAERMRIGIIILEKGPAAAFGEMLDAVVKHGSDGGKPAALSAEDQANRAKGNEDLAARNRAAGAPDLPGGVNAGGPPQIEPGMKPEDVLNNYFAFKDTSV